MAADRQDLLDAFLQRIRDEYPVTVSFARDSPELAAVLAALRRAAGEVRCGHQGTDIEKSGR